MSDSSYDYIIIGGGLAGSALTGRLAELQSPRSILILEVGPDVAGHPLTGSPQACFGAHGSPLDWAYTTVPRFISTATSATMLPVKPSVAALPLTTASGLGEMPWTTIWGCNWSMATPGATRAYCPTSNALRPTGTKMRTHYARHLRTYSQCHF